MPQPDNVSDELYQLMLQCWQLDLDERPDFQQLEEALIAFAQDPTVSPLPLFLAGTNMLDSFLRIFIFQASVSFRLAPNSNFNYEKYIADFEFSNS